MKKILLATTILGLSAGYAAAQVSWSASAGAGVASSYGDDFVSYSFMTIGVKGSAETDSGLTFSASTDLTTGTKYATGADLGDDFTTYGATCSAVGSTSTSGAFSGSVTGTADGAGNVTGTASGLVNITPNTYCLGANEAALFGMPTISVAGSFGTVSFSTDNIDFFDDTNGGGDIKYTGTFGAITAGVISDIDSGDYSVQLGYSANGLAVSVDTDSYDIYNASVAYTMGAITGTLSTDESEAVYLKLAYAADAISASVKVGDDETYDLALGYTANGITVAAEADEDDYIKVTGSYDLGAGLSLQAGADSDENAYLGAAMKF